LLELTPARPPVPALRFNQLPELRDQTPGNGALHYRKACELLDKVPDGLYEVLDRWEKLPLAELPGAEVRQTLAPYKEALDLIQRGARSESCDFEIAQRIRNQGIGALLPEIQHLRTGATLLSARARLELAEDRPDLALRTLQITYTLGRQVGQEPALICFLVGVAIATQANQALELTMSHPNTPNLSWGLITLPHPLIDLGRALQGERLVVYPIFPGFQEVASNPDAGPLKAEQLKPIASSLASLQRERTNLMMLLGSLPDPADRMVNRLLLADNIRARHEVAKKALIAAGRPADKIEQWPHVQVALMHALLEYDQVFDEVCKWQAFPYWQSAGPLAAVEKKVRSARIPGPEDPAIPLAAVLLPAVQKILLARERLERQLVALRLIEAIRLYAANHDGKLPQDLADIKEVPLPVCPVTGKSFVYRLEGARAFLETPPAPQSAVAVIQPLRYEIHLRKGESR
jgi:hypothetical protein